MAYIRPRAKPYAKMRQLLLGCELNAPKLAGVLDVAVTTARRKLQDPQKLTLGDLEKINRKGHVPIEEIREAVSP